MLLFLKGAPGGLSVYHKNHTTFSHKVQRLGSFYKFVEFQQHGCAYLWSFIICHKFIGIHMCICICDYQCPDFITVKPCSKCRTHFIVVFAIEWNINIVVRNYDSLTGIFAPCIIVFLFLNKIKSSPETNFRIRILSLLTSVCACPIHVCVCVPVSTPSFSAPKLIICTSQNYQSWTKDVKHFG